MKHLITNLIIFISCITLLSCSPKDISSMKTNTPLTIKGTLHVVGNEPFTHFAIQSKKYNTSLPLIVRQVAIEEELKAYLQKTVTLQGHLHIETKTTVKDSKQIPFYYLIVNKIK